MTFDEWLQQSPYRHQVGGVNEPFMRQVWEAATERAAKLVEGVVFDSPLIGRTDIGKALAAAIRDGRSHDRR